MEDSRGATGTSMISILYRRSAALLSLHSLPRQVVLAGCWPTRAGEAPPRFYRHMHPSWYGVLSPVFGVVVFGCPADLVALPIVFGSHTLRMRTRYVSVYCLMVGPPYAVYHNHTIFPMSSHLANSPSTMSSLTALRILVPLLSPLH